MSSPVAMLVDVLAPVEQEGTKAVVRTWFKRVGDTVDEGEPLVELDTDKVAMEVPAPTSGVLTEILVLDGQDAPRGAVIGRIAPGGASPTHTSSAPAAVGAPAPIVAASHAGPRASIATFDPLLRLSPSVRRLLLETGLDPRDVVATGRGGRLTAADVEKAAAARRLTRAAGARLAAPLPESASMSRPLVGRRVAHDTMRRRIAEHMVRSVTVAPHVTAMFEADLTAVLAHRRTHRAEFERDGVPLTLTAYMVMASAAAMTAAPVVNSRWHDDALELFDEVNVGVGTALDTAGLIVPVVHRAETLGLRDVAARLHDAVARARAGTLTPADVQRGTFTISNHGVSGSLTASPIVINQPQSAILGVGKVEKRVVVRQVDGADAMLIRPMAYVTLTIDHRAIDGAETNAWLTRFVDVLERWPVEPASTPPR